MFLFNWIKRKPKKVRTKFSLVSYTKAETLLKEGWTIAPEEDYNCNGAITRMVFLELLEEEKKQCIK